MDGSRKQIQETDLQKLLLRRLHEDDKYLHVECFSICHNFGDQLEKYFGSLKFKFEFEFEFEFYRT